MQPSGIIPRSFIDELLTRADLAALISDRTQLKKSGGNYSARCPFHEEKTPSFHVYQQADPPHYHCFGCGAHGNAIDFIMETEHCSFPDAIESLARRLGLEVPRQAGNREAVDRQRPLYKAAEFAFQTYRQALSQHPAASVARTYLQRRGITADMAERYGIGFAPPGRSFLLSAGGESHRNALKELKLFNEDDSQGYDLFRNRLMFPIRDTRGRVVAFGGRTLGEDKRKYINSPESAIFHKSQLLYGLWEARQASRKLEQLIVVEGYLDVIALSQHGLTNSVAAMGTATNEENLANLLHTSDDIVFCFDGDKAGQAAADKALLNILPLLQDGQKVQFLILPSGEDPDSLVQDEGGEAFRERISKAYPLSEFIFQSLSRGLDLTVAENKGILSSRVNPILKNLQAPVLKDALYKKLRELTRSQWKRDNKYGKGKISFKPEVVAEPPLPVPNRNAARICLALYLEPALATTMGDLLEHDHGIRDEAALFQFLKLLLEEKVEHQANLLYLFATRPDLRRRFQHLFDSIDHIFSAEEAVAEGKSLLKLVRRKYAVKAFEAAEAAWLASPQDLALQENYRKYSRLLNETC